MSRNREYVRSLLFCLAVTLAAAAASRLLVSSTAALVTAAACLVLSAFHTGKTVRRYKGMARLAEELCDVSRTQQLLDIAGEEEGDLSILRTEVYKLTLTLREQAQQLRQDKLYLANSLSDISHQLKTPLTSLLMLTQLMEDAPVPEERRQYAREMEALLHRLSFLVTALLKLSKLDAGTAPVKREQVKAAAAIDKALQPLLLPLELREVEVEIDCPQQAAFTGDSNWMAEALTNVIKNYMEHTPPGGKVRIVCQDNPLHTRFLISDTGGGIPPEDLPRVFDRFYRGKNAAQGSVGIGLALARSIVEQQGGRIQAANEGCGAIFTITLYKSIV